MMADTAPAPSQQRGLRPWQPGQSGNPHGRQKGSRNKLGEAFIEALHESFKEQGPDAIQRVINDKPEQYLKVIASLLPKELTLNMGDSYSEMSDDELLDRLHRLQAAIAPFLDSGDGSDQGCTGETEGRRLPAPVHGTH